MPYCHACSLLGEKQCPGACLHAYAKHALESLRDSMRSVQVVDEEDEDASSLDSDALTPRGEEEEDEEEQADDGEDGDTASDDESD